MKKFLKGLNLCAIASVSALALASCKTHDAEEVSIAIGVQQTSGNNYESMINFLDNLKDDLNFSYETVLLESRDNNKNLETFQQKIVGGVNGIISMVDMDENNTKALLESCEENGVYYAGYMSDFANVKNNEDVMNNKYMLGSISDGEIDGSVRGEFLFNQLVKSDNRKIVFSSFPSYAYPAAATSIAKVKELIEAYNETHEDDFTYGQTTDGKDTYTFSFTTAQLPDAEATQWKNNGVDAVVAVNSLGKRLLAPLKNKSSNIDIYTVGWDDDIIDDFGDNKYIRTLGQTPAETIVYPLVRIINAVRGNDYTDEPTGINKIVTGQYTYISSTQDLTDGRLNSMNFSTDHAVSRSIISNDEVKALVTSSPSFDSLKAVFASWTTEYALRRTK